MTKEVTPLQVIYDSFLNLITDDMYMEWSQEETYADLRNIFLTSISNFQFPRFKPFSFIEDEDTGKEYYPTELTREEINIIASLMRVEWIGRQLASVDVVRQAYSSRDFEFTSQANHMAKLTDLKKEFSREAIRMQRLYTRRATDNQGMFVPNYQGFGGKNNAN